MKALLSASLSASLIFANAAPGLMPQVPPAEQLQKARQFLEDIKIEPDASFIVEEQFFPADYFTVGSVDVVRVCKMDKLSVSENIDQRGFDRLPKDDKDCRLVTFDDMKLVVESSCPLPAVSFVHHLPHSGSTLLASMLQEVPNVRSWSEFKFLNHLNEVKSPEVAQVFLRALACTPSEAPAVERMVVKFASFASQVSLNHVRSLVPDAPWVFLYRNPADVLSRLCRHALAGEQDPRKACMVSGKWADVNTTTLYLKALMTQGLKNSMSSSFDDGSALIMDYANLLGNIEQVATHLGLNLSPEELNAVLNAAKYDPKATQATGQLVAFDPTIDAGKTEMLNNHPALVAAAESLRGVYDRLSSVSGVSGGAEAPQPPQLFPLGDIFQAWDPKDSSIPDRHTYNSLHEFTDMKAQLDDIQRYQAYEVPFLVKQSKQFAKAIEPWTEDFLKKALSQPVIKQDQSRDRRHMFHRRTDTAFKVDLEEFPTEMTFVDYPTLLENVAAELAKPLEERQTVYGTIKAENAPFIRSLDRVLPKLAWNIEDLTPWQCKMGMPGILNEAHFDRSHNLVTMISGVKRWIIIPPKYVGDLGLEQAGPYWRHASFDWSDSANWAKFDGVQAIDVILRAGDIMYLPMGWTHYVLSLDEVGEGGVNFQCNAWVGKEATVKTETAMNTFPQNRLDNELCSEVADSCKHLHLDCLKGNCPPPHEFYNCLSGNLERARAQRPSLHCAQVESTMLYHASLCQISGFYNPSTCPSVKPDVLNFVKSLTETGVADASSRRRLLGNSTFCTGFTRGTYDSSAPQSDLTRHWADSDDVYDSGAPHIPTCMNNTFSSMFVEGRTYSTTQYYACEWHPMCSRFYWENDIVGNRAWAFELEYMHIQSDMSGGYQMAAVHTDPSMSYSSRLAVQGYDTDYDGDDFDMWYTWLWNPENNSCTECFFNSSDNKSQPLSPLLSRPDTTKYWFNRWTWSPPDDPPFLYNQTGKDRIFDVNLDLDQNERYKAMLYNNIPTGVYMRDYEDGGMGENGAGFSRGIRLVMPWIMPQAAGGRSWIAWDMDSDYDDEYNAPWWKLHIYLFNEPTVSPTSAPTSNPTDVPTSTPTVGPTRAPTGSPTTGPTAAPTVSDSPTTSPTPMSNEQTNAPDLLFALVPAFACSILARLHK